LVEQLSYVLRRPIDRIVQNDDGAFATRAMLSQSGSDRLGGKRVVIYQFAARELAFGDWRLAPD
jgi:alginate O-acetyltransferase complex protein AlgJ